MDKRSQGAIEYFIMLATVIMVAGVIVYLIYSSSTGLGSSVGREIDNVRDNVIIPGLVGMLMG